MPHFLPNNDLSGSHQLTTPPLTNLRCEYLKDPLGIDTAEPRLSWEILDDRRGARQIAYELQAASDTEALLAGKPDLWETGRISSGKTVGIVYTGKPLKSGDACKWRVRVWTTDSAGVEAASSWSEIAEFSVGLLRDADWSAEWITSPGYLPEPREHVGYMSHVTRNQSEEKWVRIDLGEARAFDKIALFPTCGRRVKGPPGGELPPGDGFPAAFRIEVSDDPAMKSGRVVAEQDMGDTRVTQPVDVDFPPTSARYVRLTATRYSKLCQQQGGNFCLKLAGMEVQSRGEILSLGKPVTALDSLEDPDHGFGVALLTAGKRAYEPGERRRIKPPPLFRKEFTLREFPKRAMLHVTALGGYEVFLNGNRVGREFLAPGSYQFEKRVAVQAFDVTELLRKGGNAIGALLADGYYRVRYRLDGYDQYKDSVQGRFGDAIPRLLAQLDIQFEDGSSQRIGTDGSWRFSQEGPWRRTSMYDGVVYDARRELPGWAEAGFSDADWQPGIVNLPDWPLHLWPQTVQPVRVVEAIEPVNIKKTSSGVTLVDFGRAIGGVCRVTLAGPQGAEVSIRHIPLLRADGSPYPDSLWGAGNNAATYTLAGGGDQTFEVNFCWHGFRYAEVRGLEAGAELKKIEALSLSDDFPLLAEVETSDERLNRLWNYIIDTYRACFKSVLADVADRDERWGWMGDCFTTHAQSLACLFDIGSHYRKRMHDLLDDQSPQGFFPATTPSMGNLAAAGIWSDAALELAWSAWLTYGDRRMMEEAYEALLRYTNLTLDHYHQGKQIWPHIGFGDWLSSPFTVRPGATSWDEKGPERMNPLLLEKLRLKRNMDVMAEMAQALGRDEDHRRFQKEAQALLEDPELCAIGTTPDLPGAQSACAFALDYDAVRPEDRAQVEQRMLEAIEDYGHNLSTGTPATPALLNVLMDSGHHDLAWHLAMHPEYPSFGYMIDQQTGGIWERLDALHPTLGFNPEPMSGFIHVGFCPIAEWILRLAGGFVVPARGSGLERIRIAPVFPDYLQHSSASVQTVYGLVQVTWRRERHGILLDLTVPPGATVDLILPLEGTGQLTESGQPLQNSPGLRLGQPPDGHTELQVEGGRYSLVFSDTLLRENSAG